MSSAIKQALYLAHAGWRVRTRCGPVSETLFLITSGERRRICQCNGWRQTRWHRTAHRVPTILHEAPGRVQEWHQAATDYSQDTSSNEVSPHYLPNHRNSRSHRCRGEGWLQGSVEMSRAKRSVTSRQTEGNKINCDRRVTIVETSKCMMRSHASMCVCS